MVVANRPHWERRAFRIVGWIVLAILLAIAFHYAKKYEAEMLTDARHVESLAAPDRLIGQIILECFDSVLDFGVRFKKCPIPRLKPRLGYEGNDSFRSRGHRARTLLM